ncbi:MAG: bacteriohemerythrin, partial [Candidatus Fermentibacteria bacterium]
LLAGEPGSSFWPETYLVGLDYALSGYSSQFLFVMASRIEEAFLQRSIEVFDTAKALAVYQAFKRVFGVAVAVMVDCAAYSVQKGMQRVGINEKLFQRIRNQAIEKQVDEARQLLPLIEWNDSLSVGIQSIDDQHRKLIDLLNRLHGSSVSEKGSDTLKDILNELVEYTKTHFGYEEKLMAEFGYPEEAAHIETHGSLAGQVIEFNESFQAGKSKLSGELFSFLRKWLNGHIRGTDRKYTVFFLEHGVK